MSIKKSHTATFYLPKGGKQAWTDIMQANVKVSDAVYENQPIVMATARFKNGIWVAGGVLKSATPEEYNIKFFNTFDANGSLITEPYQPIDVSDHEDFLHAGFIFNLNDDESEEYHLKIVER
jgi:hypothetical protein